MQETPKTVEPNSEGDQRSSINRDSQATVHKILPDLSSLRPETEKENQGRRSTEQTMEHPSPPNSKISNKNTKTTEIYCDSKSKRQKIIEII